MLFEFCEVLVQCHEFRPAFDSERSQVCIHPHFWRRCFQGSKSVPKWFGGFRFVEKPYLRQRRKRVQQVQRIFVRKCSCSVGGEDHGRGGESQEALLGCATETGRGLRRGFVENCLRLIVEGVRRKGQRQPNVGVKQSGQDAGDPLAFVISIRALGYPQRSFSKRVLWECNGQLEGRSPMCRSRISGAPIPRNRGPALSRVAAGRLPLPSSFAPRLPQ